MPERNLVSPNSFKVLLVALTLVAMQVGCSKLRKNSSFLDNDYLTIEEPNFNQEPAIPEVAKTSQQVESQGRFVNDPQQALDELIELRGEFVETVEMDENPNDIIDDSEAEIVFVPQDAINKGQDFESSNAVSPPAPSIKDAIAVTQADGRDDPVERSQSSGQNTETKFVADSMEANTFESNDKALEILAAADVRDPIRLTGMAPSQLRPLNPANRSTPDTSQVIKLSTGKSSPQKANSDPDCSHTDCDCMKPKLKPELPFAKPISFPQSNQETQASPITPLSRPLSPILFDQANRQVEANDQAHMKVNSLREMSSAATPKSSGDAFQAQFAAAPDPGTTSRKLMNAFEPIETPVMSPIVLEDMGPTVASVEMAKRKIANADPMDGIPQTKYSGFEPAACQSCHSDQCDGSCGLQNKKTDEQIDLKSTEFAKTEIREPTKRESVVIVATMTNETIPPFAEHPDLEVEAATVNELVRKMNEFAEKVAQSDPANSIEQAGDEIIAVAMHQPTSNSVDTNAFTPEATEFVPVAPVDQAYLASAASNPIPESTNEFTPQSASVDSLDETDAEELTEQEWVEIFGPVVMPAQTANVEACCSECGSGDCQDVCGANADKQIANASFAPPTPIDVPSQIDPAKIPNEFMPNQSTTASHQTDVETSESQGWVAPGDGAIPVSWVAPATTNFSPVQPVPNPTVEPKAIPNPEPIAPVKSAPTSFNADADTFDVPKSDANFAPEPSAKIEDSTSASVEPVVVVEVIDNTVPWDVKLDETIEMFRGQVAQEGDQLTRNGMEVNLRLLEVIQRQLLTAEEDTSAMSNREREYWQHQLDAITMMLPGNPDASDMDRHNAAYVTLHHLRKAVEQLETIAKLSVANGAFCTEISGFGKFKPFASTTFKAGQRTLVYCEVENYMSNAQVENFQTSFHTKLRGSYVVYDGQGRAVQQGEYPIVEDVVRQKRRDFYLYFPIQIGELKPGNYRLDLLIEDLSNNKTASLNPGMKFQVEQ